MCAILCYVVVRYVFSNFCSSLLGLQINPDKAREDFRDAAKQNGGSTGVKDFMDGMGLGMIVDQVKAYLRIKCF